MVVLADEDLKSSFEMDLVAPFGDCTRSSASNTQQRVLNDR